MARRQLRALRLLAAAFALAACKTEASLEDAPCPPGGTTLTYGSFGGGFLAAHCQTCHGQAPGDREGAPEGYDFATREAVLAHRERIFARAAADNATMPPGPDDPPRAERDRLAEWLACGAP